MTTLKQGRWAKIHEQGQANFETAENVMDIMAYAMEGRLLDAPLPGPREG